MSCCVGQKEEPRDQGLSELVSLTLQSLGTQCLSIRLSCSQEKNPLPYWSLFTSKKHLWVGWGTSVQVSLLGCHPSLIARSPGEHWSHKNWTWGGWLAWLSLLEAFTKLNFVWATCGSSCQVGMEIRIKHHSETTHSVYFDLIYIHFWETGCISISYHLWLGGSLPSRPSSLNPIPISLRLSTL